MHIHTYSVCVRTTQKKKPQWHAQVFPSQQP